MTSRLADAKVVAGRLTGEPVIAIDLLPRSGNNRLYLVQTMAARYALKSYPEDAGGLGRLDNEYGALLFLNAYGAAGKVPRAYAADREAGFALYEWIVGTALLTHDTGDIDAALDFIRRAHVARREHAALPLPDAREACKSLNTVFAGLAARIERLRAAVTPGSPVALFLACDIEPRLAMAAADCRKGARRAGFDIQTEISASARTLSPSDFSFHNALRRPDGSVVFLDFEYFGWDDPVKLVSDFLWHPAMRITFEQAACFVRGANAIFGACDPHYASRLRCFFPLFGLKWCLIMLNEYLADDWNRRRFSGERRSHKDVMAAQLSKARALLGEVVGGTRELVLC